MPLDDLDDLLARTAPPVTPHDKALAAELRVMTRAAEPAVRRRRRRLAVIGVLAAGLVSTGVAGAVPLPGGFFASASGGQCRLDFYATPRGLDGEPPTRTYSAEEQRATAQAANAWLDAFDLDSVDRDAAVATWQREEAAAIAAAPPGERQPALHGDQLETTAVGQEVERRLAAYLRAAGYDQDAALYAFGSRCDR